MSFGGGDGVGCEGGCAQGGDDVKSSWGGSFSGVDKVMLGLYGGDVVRCCRRPGLFGE